MSRESEILNSFKEDLTGHCKVIVGDHSYIHKGIAFSLVGITGSVAAGGTYKIAFKTPDPTDQGLDEQQYIHWRPATIGGTATGVTAELYEGSTITGGTDATPINRNRNVPRTSKMQQMVIAGTITEGTLVGIINSGTAGAGAANAGGGSGAEHELVLKPNTVYSLTLTNRSGSTATLITYELFWYEEGKYNGN